MSIQWSMACGKYAEYFVDKLISIALKLSSKEYKIQFNLGLNSTSNIEEINKLSIKYADNVVIYDTQVDDTNPSLSHSKTLDYIHNKLPTSALYYIYSDADVCILRKDWDKFLEKDLESNDIVGVEYSNLKPQKAYGFPTAYFMATKILLTNLSFKPKMRLLNNKLCLEEIKVDEANKHIYKHNTVGDVLILDTGHEIYTKYFDKRMRCYNIMGYKNEISRGNKDIDFYYTIYLSHYRKARIRIDKDIQKVKSWYNHIDNFLTRKYSV